MSSATAPDPIRIFRPGTFVSAEGVAVSFGAAELQAIADAYDAASDPAPLVIGHPRIEDPAYGWVERLSVEDGQLVAHPGAVEPSFAELVRARRYAKVSAQFYTPDHPANPRPGSHYLKHVGFLGAHAPGVKGLGTVSLADGDAGQLVTIDLNDPETMMPDPTPAATAVQMASFAEREASLAAREAALKDEEKRLEQAAASARHADHLSFAEGLIDDGKLAPAGKDLLVGVLDRLGERPDVVSFGEGDANRMTPVAAMKKLLGGAQPLISFGEWTPAERRSAPALASFAAPAGYEIDPDQAALYARAKELQAADPRLPWMDAVRRASV